MLEIESFVADAAYLQALKGGSPRSKRSLGQLKLCNDEDAEIFKQVLLDEGFLTFDSIFTEPIGYRLMFEASSNMNLSYHQRFEFYNSNREFMLNKDISTLDNIALDIYNSYVVPIVEDTSKSSIVAIKKCIDAREVPRDLFLSLVDDALNYLRKSFIEDFNMTKECLMYCKWKRLVRNITIEIADFDLHRILGRGGFGEVFACQKIDTGHMYAIKELDKKRMKSKEAGRLAWNERHMLAQAGESRFVVCLKYAIQSSSSVFFVLDLMNGGDLDYHLSNSPNKCFSPSQALFYVSEILLGFVHLHSLRIVYRDLKPANILLDDTGHCRISDLGLARKLNPGKALHDETGTIGYMSPQVLSATNYGFDADVWSLGVLLYVMLAGRVPFQVSSSMSAKEKRAEVKRRTLENDFDISVISDDDARSLISALLEPVVKKRLGCSRSKGGIGAVRKHKFFDSIDWNDMALGISSPPITPTKHMVHAKDVMDISRFIDEPKKKMKLCDEDQCYYDGFTAITEVSWQQEMLSSNVYERIVDAAIPKNSKKKKTWNLFNRSTSNDYNCVSDSAGSSSIMDRILRRRRSSDSSQGSFTGRSGEPSRVPIFTRALTARAAPLEQYSLSGEYCVSPSNTSRYDQLGRSNGNNGERRGRGEATQNMECITETTVNDQEEEKTDDIIDDISTVLIS